MSTKVTTLSSLSLLIVALGLSMIGGCEADCLIDEGCGDRPTIALKPCGAETDGAVTLEALFSGEGPVDGARAVVEGPLRQESALCTQLGCSPIDSCCNGCGSGLGLAERGDFDLSEPGDLSLRGQIDGVELACGGDDSLVCCPIQAAGQRVRATGTIREAGVSVDGPLFSLQIEALCLAP